MVPAERLRLPAVLHNLVLSFVGVCSHTAKGGRAVAGAFCRFGQCGKALCAECTRQTCTCGMACLTCVRARNRKVCRECGACYCRECRGACWMKFCDTCDLVQQCDKCNPVKACPNENCNQKGCEKVCSELLRECCACGLDGCSVCITAWCSVCEYAVCRACRQSCKSCMEIVCSKCVDGLGKCKEYMLNSKMKGFEGGIPDHSLLDFLEVVSEGKTPPCVDGNAVVVHNVLCTVSLWMVQHSVNLFLQSCCPDWRLRAGFPRQSAPVSLGEDYFSRDVLLRFERHSLQLGDSITPVSMLCWEERSMSSLLLEHWSGVHWIAPRMKCTALELPASLNIPITCSCDAVLANMEEWHGHLDQRHSVRSRWTLEQFQHAVMQCVFPRLEHVVHKEWLVMAISKCHKTEQRLLDLGSKRETVYYDTVSDGDAPCYKDGSRVSKWRKVVERAMVECKFPRPVFAEADETDDDSDTQEEVFTDDDDNDSNNDKQEEGASPSGQHNFLQGSAEGEERTFASLPPFPLDFQPPFPDAVSCKRKVLGKRKT